MEPAGAGAAACGCTAGGRIFAAGAEVEGAVSLLVVAPLLEEGLVPPLVKYTTATIKAMIAPMAMTAPFPPLAAVRGVVTFSGWTCSSGSN